ncbi:hypothetical protein OAE12_01150, partial [bacterium]|nr:hypothetical protein [bacterium]
TVPLNLKKNEVNEFRVTNTSDYTDYTLLPFFIEENPEYKWLDTLGVDGVITGDDGTGKTNKKKFKGVKELAE